MPSSNKVAPAGTASEAGIDQALDPNFATNHFYIFYTAATVGDRHWLLGEQRNGHPTSSPLAGTTRPAKVPPAGARSGPLVHRLRYPRGEFRWFTTTAAGALTFGAGTRDARRLCRLGHEVATFRAASPAGGDTIAPTPEPEPSG